MANRKRIPGAPNVVKDLTRFLREALYTVKDDAEDAKLSTVSICQIVKGKRGEEIFSLNTPKRPGENWPDSTALDIYARLQAEATVLKGFQRYAVYTYFSDDNESHTGRFLIAVQGDDTDDDDIETEGPTKEGQLRQLQRHLEAQAKINVTQHMSTVSALSGLVTKLGDMCENLLDKRAATVELHEQLLVDKHRMDLDTMVAGKRADAIADIAKKAGMFIPAIANKLAGQNLFPVQGNAVMMMLKGLMGGIAADEARLTKLMGLLKPEEQVVFMQLYEEVGKTDDSASEGVPTGTNGMDPS